MKNKGWVPYPRHIFRKEIALSLIKKYVPSGARFLEVGCAAGDIGITLSMKGYNGLMIDFSDEAADEAIENLKKENVKNVRFEKKDFFEIDSREKFDLVTMFEVLEHIEKDKDALRKVNDLLNEKGMFLLSVPAKASLWGASDIVVGHIKRYEKKELIDLLNQSGFEVVRFISYGFPWLNMAKYIRDKLASRALKGDEEGNKNVLTKKSGMNMKVVSAPVLEVFFKKWFLFFPMKISGLFNNMDLAEGYLCLAEKKSL
ncbi:MAG: class I SAM-dependent methyltransferase [Phycisphaerae bacterium]|jgi:2-polyprenyl-3-methyl-5-hydroxy-6-metoxy-1,4-benzoquinol methylase